jgi:hypothetical protein
MDPTAPTVVGSLFALTVGVFATGAGYLTQTAPEPPKRAEEEKGINGSREPLRYTAITQLLDGTLHTRRTPNDRT